MKKIFPPPGSQRNWLIAGTLIATLAVASTIYVAFFEKDSDKRSRVEHDIKTAYETQVRADGFQKWYNTSSGSILRFALPEVISGDNSPYFEAIVWSGGLQRYRIYKDINKKWTDYGDIPWKTLSEKTGVGIYGITDTEGFNMKWVISNSPAFFFLLLIILLTVYQVRSMRATPPGMRRYSPNGEGKVLFDDIGGIDTAKAEILSTVDTIKNWKKYSDKGLRPIRGLLLYGPPGVGKTLLAKAIASEIGADMWISTGNDFRSKFISEGGQKVKLAFAKAREIAEKSGKIGILFIDEVDTVLGKRGMSAHKEDDSVVNALLQEIDGISGHSGIIVLAATNHPELLDDAAISRFDKKISLQLPTQKERADIVDKILAKQRRGDNSTFPEGIDTSSLVLNSQGMSGRDLENVLNEAHRTCIDSGESMDSRLLQRALSDYVLGKENTGIDLDEETKKRIGFHELGHAVIGFLSGKRIPALTMVPTQKALGVTWVLDPTERVLVSPEELLLDIQGLVAGRMAEKVFMGGITSGASNDYERATDIARAFLVRFNFPYGKYHLGMVPDDTSLSNPEYASWLLREISPTIAKILSDAEKQAEKTLRVRESQIRSLYIKLATDRVLYEEDLAEKLKK